MTIFKSIISKLNVNSFINRLIDSIISADKKEVFDNTADKITTMLNTKGEDSFGAKLRTDKGIISTNGIYSDKYVSVKKKKGIRTDIANLRFTGEFHKSIKSNFTKQGIEISGNFEKGINHIADNFTNLANEKDFEKRILSLNDKEMNQLISDYLDSFINDFTL